MQFGYVIAEMAVQNRVCWLFLDGLQLQANECPHKMVCVCMHM